MEPDRYQRLRRLVHAAADVSPQAREAWLRAQEPGDPALVARALALLDEAGAPTHAAGASPPGVAAAATLVGGPRLAPGLRLGPYELLGELGRGGMGVVHEARRAPGDEPVALKIILPQLLSATGARERFRREARLGLAIDHPHVVRTLDVGEAEVGGERLTYLVMERVRGRTFRRLVDELGALPEAWARELVAQAAAGLSAVHDAGAVHRDLKPENLILTDDRRVRVMDLGVAKVGSESAHLTREGLFLGSPAYAAPEQCEGLPVGPAADLYALGAVLFELASGRPPFQARDPLALLRAHVEDAPVSLRSVNPAVSPLLDEVVRVLLAKRPEQRIASARELARVLSEGESGAWWTTRAGALRPGRPDRSRPALPLVGREDELHTLRREWRAARAGHGGAVLLEAEAGLGASRLVGELLAEAEGRGEATLHGVPDGPGGSLFAPVADLLGREGLARTLAERLGLDAGPAEALAQALAGAAAVAGHEGLLARLARSLAASAPLLWVVEDLHLVGEAERRALLALARATQGHPLLLVLTTRPGLDQRLRAALAELPAFRALDLPRLDAEAMARLFEAAVGDVGLGRRLARELGPRADGVPWFALELLRELERRGGLARGADGRLGESSPRGGEAAPRALLDLVRGRLADVPDALRRVLDAAAVAGREIDPDVLSRVLARPRVEVLEDLATLERRHALLRSGPRRFRFDHALIEETLYHDLPAALRAALHDAFADALAAASDPAAAAPARIAFHRLRGADPAASWAAVEAALRDLAAQRREGERTALLQEALAVPRLLEGGARFERLLEVALHSREVGRAAECAALLAEAEGLARAAGDASLAARVALRRGFDAILTADFAAAAEQGATALALFERVRDDAGRVDALNVQGKAAWCLGRPQEARRRTEEALALARTLGDPRHVARVQGNLAVLLQELGLAPEAEVHQRQMLAVLRGSHESRNLGSALNDLANTLIVLGRLTEARPLFEEALELTHRGGLLELEAVVLVNLGELRLRLGDLEGARAALEPCLLRAQEAGARRVEAYALHGLGLLAWWSGDRALARRRFEEALRLRRAIENRGPLAESQLQLGMLDAESGDAQAARTRLQAALSLATAVSDPSTAVLAQVALAGLPGGDPDAARAALAQRGDALRGDALLEARCRLWLASGVRSDLDAARAVLAGQLEPLAPGERAAILARVPYARWTHAGRRPAAT